MAKIVVERDSLIVIKSSRAQIQVIKQIETLILDIRSYASILRNIMLSHCNSIPML